LLLGLLKVVSECDKNLLWRNWDSGNMGDIVKIWGIIGEKFGWIQA